MRHLEAAQPDRLRVLSVIPGANTGASMIFARRQAESLGELGVENQSFYLATRTSVTGLCAEYVRFRKVVRCFQPDLVHAHFGTMTALFCVLGTRLPLVVTFRGSDLNPCPSMFWLRSLVGRAFSQVAAIRAQCVVCVSRQLRRRVNWRRGNVFVIPTGVDTQVFFPQSREAARRRLGWPAGDPVVLFNAGRQPAVKRLDLAQAAVDEARRRIGNLQFVVMDGKVEPDHVPLMMNASDCLLMTSDWEGSPNVVKEALACNLPVVAVDVGDVRERLRSVSPGAIVPRDAAALSQAVVEIVTTPRRSNGCKAAEQVSLKAIAQELVMVYRRAIGQRDPTHGTEADSSILHNMPRATCVRRSA